MKAYVLHHIGDLRYEDVSVPACPPGWAIVKVMAAGICSSDIARVFSSGTYHFPTIPGHEFAGIVDAVGEEKDSVLIGKHVGVFPLIPCRQCSSCAAKRYETCEHYDYLGSRRDGGFAEYVAVPVWNLIEVSRTVPFSTVAMLEPFSVALHAVKQAGELSGRSVAVIGPGMIGFSAAFWAKERGASHVWVVGRSEAKRRLVDGWQGVEYISGMSQIKADVTFEAVGSLQSISMAVQSTAPGGQVILVGNPNGDIPFKKEVYWSILRRQLRLSGTWNSQFDGVNPSDWTEAVYAAEAGKLPAQNLLTHLVPQSELFQALEMMYRHEEPYCKVMTLWNVE